MNVGRSQMAQALYNQATDSEDAGSAGVTVQKPGQTVAERAQEKPGVRYIIQVMEEEGLDVSNCTRRQLTADMPAQYDAVISMAEREFSPDWLLNAPNYRYWQIDDPKGLSYDVASKTRDILKQKIADLLAEQQTVLGI